MKGRLQLTLAAGDFAAGLGLGMKTTGPSPPSAAGMSTFALRDDAVEGGNENRRRAEKRRPRAGNAVAPGSVDENNGWGDDDGGDD